MKKRFRASVKEWANTHLKPSSNRVKEYYSLRLKSSVIRKGLTPNYGNDHYVSKLGRVYKKITNELWEELPYSVTIHYNGIKPKYYVYVTIHSKKNSLSRLVASIWVVKKSPLYNVVMHLDDDRLNNTYTNLMWGTQSQNVMMSVRKGHYNKFHRDRKLTIEQQNQLLEDWYSGKFTQKALAEKYGFKGQSSIEAIIRRYGKNTK